MPQTTSTDHVCERIEACWQAAPLAEVAGLLMKGTDFIEAQGERRDALLRAYAILREEIANYAGLTDDERGPVLDQAIIEDYG